MKINNKQANTKIKINILNQQNQGINLQLSLVLKYLKKIKIVKSLCINTSKERREANEEL